MQILLSVLKQAKRLVKPLFRNMNMSNHSIYSSNAAYFINEIKFDVFFSLNGRQKNINKDMQQKNALFLHDNNLQTNLPQDKLVFKHAARIRIIKRRR